MSWSVAGIGRAAAVRKAIADQFTSSTKCSEPEETVRLAAASTIDAALAAQDPAMPVKVMAGGSQGFKDWQNKTGPSNSLSISIEPMHGFVE